MNLLDSLKVAWVNVRANRLRSALTMLGVVIGVACVVIMVAIVEGARKQVLTEFKGFGSNLVVVFYNPDREKRGGSVASPLSLEDVETIRGEAPLVREVSPEMNLSLQARRNGQEKDVHLVGIIPDYAKMRDVKIASGRFIEQSDLDNWNPVCVLGAKVASDLFKGEQAVGKEIKTGSLRLTVVGVAAKRGRSFGENYDEYVYAPITMVHKRLSGNDTVQVIYAEAPTPELAEQTADEVWAVLMRHHDNKPDYVVDTQTHVLGAIEKVLGTFRWVLGGIGALSLLVGGIGIMNITLVSVTERTREIGLRKAVGASRRDILLQFLTESVALSGLGGLVGVALGASLSLAVGWVAGALLPTHVPAWATVMGFTFAAGVGIVFGIYPAYRAASLDPIQALRWE